MQEKEREGVVENLGALVTLFTEPHPQQFNVMFKPSSANIKTTRSTKRLEINFDFWVKTIQF
eukprot:5952161-Amphidinium_carterae.1